MMMPIVAPMQTLLQHLIDYAGLFPPAKLDMADTVRNYAGYLDSDDAWMLGRLIVPVARFEEFEAHADGLLPSGAEDEPWRISALTVPAGDEKLDEHLGLIESFNQRHADSSQGLALVDVIELKAPDANSIDEALDLMSDEVFPFFEVPIADDPRGLIATLVGSDAGAKVRTGGVSSESYPRAEHLARFIMACATTGVPFKATAGLHHPLRHRNETVGADEFGFLNVFVAAALAGMGEVDTDDVNELLYVESIDEFTFSDDSIAWRDCVIAREQLEDIRLGFAVSFGSCSFDEPRAELRSLGLL